MREDETKTIKPSNFERQASTLCLEIITFEHHEKKL